MPNFQRSIDTYDPIRDLAERWPAWTIEEKRLQDDQCERFYLDLRVVVIDLDKWGGDRERAWAHVIVHLDEGHHSDDGPEDLPKDQEDLADWLADLRLDRLDDRSWGMSQS